VKRLKKLQMPNLGIHSLRAFGLFGLVALVVACGGGGRNQPTQTPFVVTATPPPTVIVVTATPVTPIPVTATPVPSLPPPPPTTCAGAPTIEFFTADPFSIVQGQFTTLRWGNVLGATAVGIDQGIGGVPAPGTIQVSPTSTTTYTMLATGCGGQTQKSLTVTVNSAPTGVPPPTNPPPPTNVPPPTATNAPAPTATPEPCASQISNIQISAPSNPGNALNVSAMECYGGERGEGVSVVAAALDDESTPVPGSNTPSVSVNINQSNTVNLSITRGLGAPEARSTQVQVCFQTAQGEKFGCAAASYVMDWQ
jgi:hypothetical protein